MKRTKVAWISFESASRIAQGSEPEAVNQCLSTMNFGLMRLATAIADIYDKLEDIEQRLDDGAKVSHRRPSM